MTQTTHDSPRLKEETPRGDATGFVRYFRYDVLSGFLVFLIALPLCLGIALASGYPAIAGIFTAMVGAIVTTFLSNSELTIKGPAAGLIVIALGAIEAFGGDGAIGGFSEADMTAYRMALAVGAVAAVAQILFGLLRAGVLGEFFPLSAVHGMLAAIGVIIIAKQFPVMLGVEAKGEPLELLREIPHFIVTMNPAIALLGGLSVAIMFCWPYVKKVNKTLHAIPAPMVVLLFAIPMGIYLHLTENHDYTLGGKQFYLGEKFLVNMPEKVFGMFDYVTMPDFSAFTNTSLLPTACKWAFLYFAIGSLESVLSAKAIDMIDPWKRKTNLDRDLMAVGAANLCSAMIGGLPMISEIVRSKANIDNGARTRFADFWHGVFLLACVALIPMYLHLIPLAALAAMLVYVGFRLAHPSEFYHVYRIGREQLVIFVATLVGVLATDLLIGVAIGVGVELLLYWINNVPVRSFFNAKLEVEQESEDTVVVIAREPALFTNWILVRRQLLRIGLKDKQNVILDLSGARLVDHSVMEKLHELDRDFNRAGLRLEIAGLENHEPFSDHPLAGRRSLRQRVAQEAEAAV
jgi:MFS superfamily sulfate permease-like transporter